jgi:hypothetical protein
MAFFIVALTITMTAVIVAQWTVWNIAFISHSSTFLSVPSKHAETLKTNLFCLLHQPTALLRLSNLLHSEQEVGLPKGVS